MIAPEIGNIEAHMHKQGSGSPCCLAHLPCLRTRASIPPLLAHAGFDVAAQDFPDSRSQVADRTSQP